MNYERVVNNERNDKTMEKEIGESDGYEVFSVIDHLRLRPEYYYPQIGSGAEYDDCVYLMLQQIVDNSVDEFMMGHGNRVEIYVDFVSAEMRVRDYGRGMPLEWLNKVINPAKMACMAGLYSSDYRCELHFPHLSLICALSSHCLARTVRSGEYGQIVFERGNLVSNERGKCSDGEKNGFLFSWIPDSTIITGLSVVEDHIVNRIKKCVAANPGMSFILNGKVIVP